MHRYIKVPSGEIWCTGCKRYVGRTSEDEKFRQEIYGKPFSLKQFIRKLLYPIKDPEGIEWNIYRWKPKE